MAKDTNDKTTKDALGTQYRVNFSFQDDKFNLRAGSLIIVADSPDHAKVQANITLTERFENRYRITTVKPW